MLQLLIFHTILCSFLCSRIILANNAMIFYLLNTAYQLNMHLRTLPVRYFYAVPFGDTMVCHRGGSASFFAVQCMTYICSRSHRFKNVCEYPFPAADRYSSVKRIDNRWSKWIKPEQPENVAITTFNQTEARYVRRMSPGVTDNAQISVRHVGHSQELSSLKLWRYPRPS